MSYSIKEVAEKVGVSAYTLRYYEKDGILPPIPRNKSGRREYSDEHIAWIELVTCLKETNMPVREIKRIVALSIEGDETIETRKEILLDHKKEIKNQMNQLKASLKKIDKKISFYEGEDGC